jgi:hypothetical protein
VAEQNSPDSQSASDAQLPSNFRQPVIEIAAIPAVASTARAVMNPPEFVDVRMIANSMTSYLFEDPG